MGVHADLAFALAPAAGGGTALTQAITMHQPWLLAHLFPRLFGLRDARELAARAEAQWAASLANIKAILEEEPAPARPASASA